MWKDVEGEAGSVSLSQSHMKPSRMGSSLVGGQSELWARHLDLPVIGAIPLGPEL